MRAFMNEFSLIFSRAKDALSRSWALQQVFGPGDGIPAHFSAVVMLRARSK